MFSFTEVSFWISFVIVIYTYIGYPLILLLIVSVKKMFYRDPQPGFSDEFQPVTLIVASYNEANIIDDKIKNCLQIDYPPQLIRHLFVTDGSTDDTAARAKKYPSIQVLHEPERKGKLAAINRAMSFVETDIVVFSDANTLLNTKSIRNIVRHYSNNKVGGVAGEKRVASNINDTAVGKGEGLYWKYESFIKKLDSDLHTVVGAAGELFSIRKSLYTPLPSTIILEDFVQSLLPCVKGYIVRYEPEAYSIEPPSTSLNDEMERKIRISAGAYQAILYLKRLLNFLAFPVTSFQYISHRVLRWTLAPIALIVLFFTSFVISPGLFFVQTAFYIAAFAGWLIARANRNPGILKGILNVPFYFAFMNICTFAGFIRFLSGKQPAAWKRADRPGKI